MGSQANHYFSTPQQLRMAHAIDQDDTAEISSLIHDHVVGANEFGLVDQKQKGDERVMSLLTYAVLVKAKASIGTLIQNGANPNFRTPGGWSALAEAASSSDDSLLPFLLSKGGNINLKCSAERPLTFEAYMSGYVDRMWMLLDKGANINATDFSGETLLLLMANLNDYTNMIKLLGRGADPTLTRGENKVSVAWTVQDQKNLTPEKERLRGKLMKALETKGVHFPVPRPAVYRWDPAQHKFVLPGQ